MKFLLFTILICTSLYAQTTTTPKGSTVDLVIHPEDISEYMKGIYLEEVMEDYPFAIVLSEVTNSYNCHSFAFNTSEGGPLGYVPNDEVHEYWDDDSYIETTMTAGAKVYYPSNEHSAIVYTEPGKFISKWSYLPLMIHTPELSPYKTISDLKYYAHYDRNLTNVTLNQGAKDSRKITSNSDFEMSNITISNGTAIDFVAKGKFIIGSGTLFSGGKITFKTVN